MTSITKELAIARKNLLSKLPKNSTGAEVGSWKGDFSEHILNTVQPEKLFLIDPYKHFGEYQNAWYGGQAGGQEKMDEIFESVQQRFADAIAIGKLSIVRLPSAEGINSIENNSLDWIYIDGNHTYEFVINDLETSWSKVKLNGFITGDDYGIAGWWDDGVTKAVNEFIGKNKNRIKIISFEDSQFILQKINE